MGAVSSMHVHIEVQSSMTLCILTHSVIYTPILMSCYYSGYSNIRIDLVIKIVSNLKVKLIYNSISYFLNS